MSSYAATLDVCICTFKRQSLAKTLQSISAQILPEGQSIRAIVADNDETPSGETLARETAARLGLALLYVHAPARNISIARNACLAAAQAPLVAFIDDDEEAEPGWAAALAGCLEDTGADIAFGPVKAVYDADTPAWVRRADMHSFQPRLGADGVPETGYTSSVMMRREVIGDLRFDPTLGRSGGEDTVFFHQLSQAGALLAYCDEAVVTEPVPKSRANLGWLLRRSFRSGQTHGRLLQSLGKSAAGPASSAAMKALYCGTGAVFTLSSVKRRRALHRGALHLGVIAYMLGREEGEIYGAVGAPAAGEKG